MQTAIRRPRDSKKTQRTHRQPAAPPRVSRSRPTEATRSYAPLRIRTRRRATKPIVAQDADSPHLGPDWAGRTSLPAHSRTESAGAERTQTPRNAGQPPNRIAGMQAHATQPVTSVMHASHIYLDAYDRPPIATSPIEPCRATPSGERGCVRDELRCHVPAGPARLDCRTSAPAARLIRQSRTVAHPGTRPATLESSHAPGTIASPIRSRSGRRRGQALRDLTGRARSHFQRVEDRSWQKISN